MADELDQITEMENRLAERGNGTSNGATIHYLDCFRTPTPGKPRKVVRVTHLMIWTGLGWVEVEREGVNVTIEWQMGGEPVVPLRPGG